MDVKIAVRHADISPAMRDHAQDRADRMGTHFEFLTDMHVTLNFNAKRSEVEMIAHTRKGEQVVAIAQGDDMMLTVDAAADKMMRQLRQFKEMIKAHRPRRTQTPPA